jgi:hypothetical protein
MDENYRQTLEMYGFDLEDCLEEIKLELEELDDTERYLKAKIYLKQERLKMIEKRIEQNNKALKEYE